MVVKQVTKYVASDGRIFDDGEEANRYDRKIVLLEDLLSKSSIEKIVKHKQEILRTLVELIFDNDELSLEIKNKMSYLLIEKKEELVAMEKFTKHAAILSFMSNNHKEIRNILLG